MFNTMTLFFAGQIVLFILMYAGWRYFHHHPNLAARIERIRHYISKRLRTEKLHAELKRSQQEHSVVHRKLQRTKAVLNDLVVGADTDALMGIAIGYGLLAFVMFEGDAVMFLWLNSQSGMGGLDGRSWAPFASWAALTMLMLVHGALVSQIGDHRTPGLTRKRACVGVGLSGSILFLAVCAALSGRGIDFAGAVWEPTVIVVGFWVIVFTVALTGGSASVVAQFAYNEARPDAKLMELEALDQEYARHISAIIAEIKSLASTPLDGDAASSVVVASQGEFPGMGGRRAAGPSVVAVLMVGFLLVKGSVAYAEPGMPTSATTPPSQTVTAAGVLPPRRAPSWLLEGEPVRNSCELLIDVSGSIGNANKQQLADAGAAMLPNLLSSRGCSLVRLSAFSGDGPYQPIQELSIPVVPGDRPCDKAADEPRKNILGALYPAYAKLDSDKAVEQCRLQQQGRHEQESQSRQAAVASAAKAVRNLGTVVAYGTCTPIFQAGARALRRSQYIVIITDADNDCPWYQDTDGTPLKVPVPLHGLLEFLLVPKAEERNTASEATLDRGATAQAIFPGAKVNLLNEAAGASFWQHLHLSETAN